MFFVLIGIIQFHYGKLKMFDLTFRFKTMKKIVLHVISQLQIIRIFNLNLLNIQLKSNGYLF